MRKSKRYQGPTEKLTCANCGKQWLPDDLELIANAILSRKPACSFECNKALRQVK